MTDTTKLADELVNLCDSIGAALNGDALSDGRFNLSVWVAHNYDDILTALRAAPVALADKPAAWAHHCDKPGDCDLAQEAVISAAVKDLWLRAAPKWVEHYTIPLYAAINGPAACKTLPSSQEEAGRAGIVGSGAAPIEGLADAIAHADKEADAWERIDEEPQTAALYRALATAARAYQEAAAEQERIDRAHRIQLAEAHAEFARVKGERDRMLSALEMICHTPIMPFPDPEAHSWQAFGEKVHRAWCDIQRCTCAALIAPTPAKG